MFTEEDSVAAVDDDEKEVVVQAPIEVFRHMYELLDLIVAKINMDFQIHPGINITIRSFAKKKNYGER